MKILFTDLYRNKKEDTEILWYESWEQGCVSFSNGMFKACGSIQENLKHA